MQIKVLSENTKTLPNNKNIYSTLINKMYCPATSIALSRQFWGVEFLPYFAAEIQKFGDIIVLRIKLLSYYNLKVYIDIQVQQTQNQEYHKHYQLISPVPKLDKYTDTGPTRKWGGLKGS